MKGKSSHRLRLIRNNPERMLKEHFCLEGVLTDIRLVVPSSSSSSYASLNLTALTRQRLTSLVGLCKLAAKPGSILANTLARIGHEAAATKHGDTLTLQLTKHQYERFGMTGRPLKTLKSNTLFCVTLDTSNQKQMQRAETRASWYDNGPFGSPINDTFYIGSAEFRRPYKARQSFVDVDYEFGNDEAAEWLDHVGAATIEKGGDSVLYVYDDLFIASSAELADVLNLDDRFILIGRVLHTHRTIVLVNVPGKPMTTLLLESLDQ